MRKIIYICDRCGKQIDTDPVKILATHYYYQDNATILPDDDEEGAMLCEDCWYMVDQAVVAAMQMKDVKPPKKEVQKKEPANKVQLDLGKVAALHNAGWSITKIAEEFGCSAQTIANHLQEALEYLKNKNQEEEE